MQFPRYLSQLEYLRENKMIKFKEESINFDGINFKFTIVSYMIADSKLWDDPLARECRGIVYNEKGECVSAPFHKFFNVGEREETQLHNLPDDYAAVMDKRDGSMVHPVLLAVGLHKKIVFKTKKSFYSDVALAANTNVSKEVLELSRHLLEKDYTPIFEYTDPNYQIVIDYGTKHTWKLLAVRDNIRGTYQPITALESLAERFKVPLIEHYFSDTCDTIIEETKEEKGKEGYVIRFSTQGSEVWVKAKTKWYLDRHHLMTEIRERDIADHVVDETIDDMKSFISSIGYDLKAVEKIETKVVNELTSIRSEVEALCEKMKLLETRKNMALAHLADPLFGMAIKMIDGKEPDVTKYWVRTYRENYSLRTIYSTFSGDE